MMEEVHSRLGRNSRRSTPLRSVTTARLTTARRERGIASPQTVPIGLTGKHRRDDGSNDDQEGQSENRKSMHGGDVSWGGRGVPWEETSQGMARDYKWTVGRTQTARFGYLNLTLTAHIDRNGGDVGTDHVTNDPNWFRSSHVKSSMAQPLPSATDEDPHVPGLRISGYLISDR